MSASVCAWRVGAALVTIGLVLSSCGAQPPAPPAPAAVVAPPASASAAPADSGEPPEPPAAASPFHLAATIATPGAGEKHPALRVHEIDGRVLVGFEPGDAFAEWKDGKLTPVLAFGRGLTPCMHEQGDPRMGIRGEGLLGAPDTRVYLAVTQDLIQSEVALAMDFTDKGWRLQGKGECSPSTFSAVARRKQQVLLFAASRERGCASSVRVLEGGGKPPVLTASDCAGKGADKSCATLTAVRPDRAIGFADGVLVTVSDGGMVERWAPGELRGKVDTLPPGGLVVTTTGLVASSSTDVYVSAEETESHTPEGPLGFLWRHDGAAWSSVPLPDPAGVRSVAIGTDGTLWIVSRSSSHIQLWSRPRAGTWAKVPVDGDPESVWALRSGDVWVTTSEGRLLTRSTPREVVSWDGTACKPVHARVPAVKECPELFVAMGRAGDEADLPDVRRALAGQRELQGMVRLGVTDEGGEKTWVARIAAGQDSRRAGDARLSLARKVASVVKSKVASAELLCGAPELAREVSLSPRAP